ncbi:MAG: T9SS type A sorting domain-containing protein [Bacteroidales bacterium]|jgi:hypothetical protein|nr:T9SS type A sorting domain-containing protein [Bacteroidales bacterium]
MKTKLHFLLVMLVCPMLLSSQTYFDRTYDIGDIDHPVAFVADQAGSVIVCGWFEDGNHENQRAFALKVNNFGDEVWRVTSEETSKYMALCITENGHIAIAGSKSDYGFISLINNESGEEIWSYADDTSEGFWFGSVNEISNGTDFRLHAALTTDATHPATYYLFDAENGNFIESVENPNNINSPVYVSGKMATDEIWFGYLDAVFCSRFDGTGFIWSFGAQHIAGIDKYSPTQGCVVRVEGHSIGLLIQTIQGEGTYGEFFDIIQQDYTVTGSGSLGTDKLLVTGTIDGEMAIWFIEHDLSAMTDRSYPSTYPRMGIDILGLPTNDMLIMGKENSGPGDDSDLFLMKLDSEGLVSTHELSREDKVWISPNPTSGTININGLEEGNVEVSIYNNLGQIVKKVSHTSKHISIEELTNGFYMAVVSVDGKFVKQEKLIKW